MKNLKSTFKIWDIFKHSILGNPIRLKDRHRESLGKFHALSVLSSDALSSVAYASEEILLILVGIGSMIFLLNLWISASIIALMIIIVLSYIQTIRAYPGGGGAYTVSRENLGTFPSLLAAASLLLDYILTVAVSISSGVLAITSMLPQTKPFAVLMALSSILLIILLNLRGIRESGTIFSLPTYGFIVFILWMIIHSFIYPISPIIATTHNITSDITLFLILRAFSGGCTALTGIEAISNGVSIFKEPRSKNAVLTLLMMGSILSILFISISFLCMQYQILPNPDESVLSQIAHTTFGNGLEYQLVQIFTALILLLAANTAFADFPRLSSLLARDGYLPKQLSNTGDRLAFSNGIILLGVLACILIILFNADTHALIPLYAIGVFMSFTLSQTGMVVHWFGKHAFKMLLNGLGALCCFTTLIVISVSKFFEGAWIVFALIPIFIVVLNKIKKHYTHIDEELEVKEEDLNSFNTVYAHKDHFKVLIPIKSLNKGVLKAIKFAKSLSHDVIILKIEHDLMTADSYLEKKNLEHLMENLNIHLEVINSEHRSMISPIIDYMNEMEEQNPEREIVIILPEFVPQKHWHTFLHNHTSFWLKIFLVQERKKKGTTRIIIDIPYYVEG
jgi:amino acid transporter